MNTIIIYSSKYGCTKDCANILKINYQIMSLLLILIIIIIIKLSYQNLIKLLLEVLYMLVQFQKIQVLCNDNVELLNKKQVGIFLCCGFSEQADKYLKSNFPSSLLESANAIGIFGSEARLEKMKFLDKLIMKAVSKGNYDSFRISQDNIDNFLINLNS